MGVTKNYSRPKSTTTNNTGIAFTLLAAEAGGTKAVFGGGQAGATGNLDAAWQADADESGSNDVQDIFKLTATLNMGSGIDAKPSITVVVTPVLGSGADGTAKTMTVEHEQTMDAWQTAAGRAQQA